MKPECISISKSVRALASAACLFTLFAGASAFAAPPAAPPGAAGGSGTGASAPKDTQEEFSSSPFTEYGEFNEEADEEAETRFLQYGRLFGVSVGAGTQTITGNRGQLWQGGWPVLDVKLHYWFDFNLALDLGINTASHYYNTTIDNRGQTEVNMFRLGADLRYYFDTRDLASAISFANPFVLLGAGSFSKTENYSGRNESVSDSAFGLTMGGGLEFAIRPRKSYFQIEFRATSVNFKDTRLSTFNSINIPDLTGMFMTITGNVMFTW